MRKVSSQRSQLRDSTSKLEQQDRKIEEQNRRIEALITELHQCQSDIRQLQTPCKDRAAGASSVSVVSPAPSVSTSEAKSPAVSSSGGNVPQTQEADCSNTRKRPLSPSAEGADFPTNKRAKCRTASHNKVVLS